MKYNQPLYLAKNGDIELNILNKRVLEIEYCYNRPTNTSPLEWNFVNNGVFTAPNTLSVTINGSPATISNISFKRRPSYAPLKVRDLRITNWLYLTLNTDIPDNATVIVKDSTTNVLKTQLSAVKNPNRVTPIIHVNQVGYAPNFSKKAMIGYYVGNAGELDLSYITSFNLIDENNNIVFTGVTKIRKDTGYNYSPLPYQNCYELDFTNFNQVGKYRIKLGDLGTSLSFNIHDGIFLNLARTLGLGLLNQRCGYKVTKPFSRHEKNACHLTAEIPMPESSYPETWSLIGSESSIKNSNDLFFKYPAPQSVDIQGLSHDAGDYSRYGQNIGLHIHCLSLAADMGLNFDNLGLPESSNGINDLLDLAKWEADGLLKLQDKTDGGFYILIYPKTRAYELTMGLQTDTGDPNVLWPKNTIGTAIASACLAELGSSPSFRNAFGAALGDKYINAAKQGWTFLMAAITKYGLAGSYQQIRGGDSDQTGALSYCAAALFAATGDTQYSAKLYQWLPDSNNVPWQWGWKLMHGYYGCAVRVYSFAARSGRRNINELNSAYLTGCDNQIIRGGDGCVNDSKTSAYGASIPYDNRNYAGSSFAWFFLTEEVFRLAVAHKINPKPEYIEAGISTYNYLVGCNPINVSSISGIGQKRPRIFVSQYQLNDPKNRLAPNGQIRASVSAGPTYLDKYVNTDNSNELTPLIFPDEYSQNNKYSPEDRYIDQFQVMDEETVAPVIVRGIVFACWLANQNSYKNQPYRPL